MKDERWKMKDKHVIPHFYIGDEDCGTMFNDFKIIDISNVRQLTQYGNFSPHYHIWLKNDK